MSADLADIRAAVSSRRNIRPCRSKIRARGLRNTRLVRGESLTASSKRIDLANQLDGAFMASATARRKCAPIPTSTPTPRSSSRARNSKPSISTKRSPRIRAMLWQGRLRPGRAARAAARGKGRAICRGGSRRLGHAHEQPPRRRVARRRARPRAERAARRPRKQRGLLETTLVAVVSEFGRSPELDGQAGRNHHPIAFSHCARRRRRARRQVYGATDPTGREVARDKVSVHDFNATIAHLMGVNPAAPVVVPGGRALTLAGPDTSPNKGKPIAALI